MDELRVIRMFGEDVGQPSDAITARAWMALELHMQSEQRIPSKIKRHKRSLRLGMATGAAAVGLAVLLVIPILIPREPTPSSETTTQVEPTPSSETTTQVERVAIAAGSGAAGRFAWTIPQSVGQVIDLSDSVLRGRKIVLGMTWNSVDGVNWWKDFASDPGAYPMLPQRLLKVAVLVDEVINQTAEAVPLSAGDVIVMTVSIPGDVPLTGLERFDPTDPLPVDPGSFPSPARLLFLSWEERALAGPTEARLAGEVTEAGWWGSLTYPWTEVEPGLVSPDNYWHQYSLIGASDAGLVEIQYVDGVPAMDLEDFAAVVEQERLSPNAATVASFAHWPGMQAYLDARAADPEA